MVVSSRQYTMGCYPQSCKIQILKKKNWDSKTKASDSKKACTFGNILTAALGGTNSSSLLLTCHLCHARGKFEISEKHLWWSSIKKTVHKNVAKFTGNRLFSFLKNKVAGFPATSLKKRLWRRCFPVNFAAFLKTSIFLDICERLFLLFQSILGYSTTFIWKWIPSRVL